MAPVAPPLAPHSPLQNNNKKQTHSRHHNNNHKERVRTLFISGLPEDIKHREIYNLFRRRPGFEACQLKYTGRGYQIVAFAVFSHHQLALAAKDVLNGLTFDPETGATLNIELARTNSRIKRSGTDDGGNGPYDKRIRGPFGVPGVFDDDGVGETVKMPGSSNIVQSGGVVGGSLAGEDGNSGPTKEQAPGPGGNPPCPTLFVANLGPTCTEGELREVLSRFQGFKMLKLQTKGGMPVAFVDFEDVTSSAEALKQLQDTLLPSSDRGGLHLEYAKSRMKYPREDKLLEKEMKQVFPFSFCDEA
uniref:RRM domain-containing protein n=1 Tax=Picea sitchensis TaxID=3332 RepID=B8LQ91_PICSI|nr:unknown [Picea sitchensis]